MMRAPATATATALLSLALAAGCQTTVTTSDGGPPAPKPRDAEAPPKNARVNAVAVTFAPKPSDTNGNLLPDTLQTTVYLFSRPHKSPIFADGDIGFAIYRLGEAGTPDRPGPNPLRSWDFSRDEVAAARSQALVGPCHEIALSLLADGGRDDIPVESVDLVAWFDPADGGERVWLRGVRSVQYPRPQR